MHLTAEQLAPLEEIPPEGWFSMAERDTLRMAVLAGSPFVLSTEERIEAGNIAARLTLFSWWARAYTQSVMTICAHRRSV
jgi:hypothetical protein